MKINKQDIAMIAVTCLAAGLFYSVMEKRRLDPNRVELSAPAVINTTNADNKFDRLDRVTLSVSEGVLRHQNKAWRVYANQHTPRGRFRIGGWQPAERFKLTGTFVLPFKSVVPIDMPNDNPQKASAMATAKYSVWAIHADNRPTATTVGAGCILTDPDTLAKIAFQVQGATLVITD